MLLLCDAPCKVNCTQGRHTSEGVCLDICQRRDFWCSNSTLLCIPLSSMLKLRRLSFPWSFPDKQWIELQTRIAAWSLEYKYPTLSLILSHEWLGWLQKEERFISNYARSKPFSNNSVETTLVFSDLATSKGVQSMTYWGSFSPTPGNGASLPFSPVLQ